jgi:hypothetical protein
MITLAAIAKTDFFARTRIVVRSFIRYPRIGRILPEWPPNRALAKVKVGRTAYRDTI